jgi:hypothetical protein
MSIWSVFYSGNIDRLKILLEQENWEGIENAGDIKTVNFSGGCIEPFLMGDDFDPLSDLKEKNAVRISKLQIHSTKPSGARKGDANIRLQSRFGICLFSGQLSNDS